MGWKILRNLTRTHNACTSFLIWAPSPTVHSINCWVQESDFFVAIFPVVTYRNLSCNFLERFRWATTGDISIATKTLWFLDWISAIDQCNQWLTRSPEPHHMIDQSCRSHARTSIYCVIAPPPPRILHRKYANCSKSTIPQSARTSSPWHCRTERVQRVSLIYGAAPSDEWECKAKR